MSRKMLPFARHVKTSRPPALGRSQGDLASHSGDSEPTIARPPCGPKTVPLGGAPRLSQRYLRHLREQLSNSFRRTPVARCPIGAPLEQRVDCGNLPFGAQPPDMLYRVPTSNASGSCRRPPHRQFRPDRCDVPGYYLSAGRSWLEWGSPKGSRRSFAPRPALRSWFRAFSWTTRQRTAKPSSH